MRSDVLITVISLAASVLLVVTGLLNFSVFVRQLRAAREQLDTARKQLETALRQPEIQMIQRAFVETSDHLKYFLERPYLRPYFYENRAWKEGDVPSRDEVMAMAELLLNEFASSIIQSASFPEYPMRGVEQTIRFHMQKSPAMREFLLSSFDRYPLSGLALLCLKNANCSETESDLVGLVESPGIGKPERRRREALLEYIRNAESADPLELAKYSLSLNEAFDEISMPERSRAGLRRV